MDGKTGAEELIAKAIADPALLEALVSSPNPDGEDAAETEKDEEK
jgi:type VI secretion system protein ImpB